MKKITQFWLDKINAVFRLFNEEDDEESNELDILTGQ